MDGEIAAELRAAGTAEDSFVPAPDGSLDYGEIGPEIGRQAGKIRLRNGNEAWGRRHIIARHADQLAGLGFHSVEDFVAHVARSYNAVYARKGSGLDLVVEGPQTGKRLIVQPEPHGDGDFYDLKSLSPVRSDQFKNRKPLWVRAGTSAPGAEGAPPFSQGPEQF